MIAKALYGPTLLVTALLLGGCVSSGLQDEPPSYFAGYDAGCEIGAAMVIAGAHLPRKDESRYAADPAYRRGWEEGYNECQMEVESVVGV